MWKDDLNMPQLDEIHQLIFKEGSHSPDYRVRRDLFRQKRYFFFVQRAYFASDIYYQLCLKKVKEDAKNFLDVQFEAKTQELCDLAFKTYPQAFSSFPIKFRTRSMLEKMKEFGLDLESKSLKISDVSGQRNMYMHPDNIKRFGGPCEPLLKSMYVDMYMNPDSIKRLGESCELLLKIWNEDTTDIEQNYYIMLIEIFPDKFTSIPNKFKTEKMCKDYVSDTSRSVWFGDIPEEKLTPEICEIALKRNGKVFRLIPKEKRTISLCNLAVEKDPENWNYVPLEFLSDEQKLDINLGKIPRLKSVLPVF